MGPSGLVWSHPLAAVASGTRSRAVAGMESCWIMLVEDAAVVAVVGASVSGAG